MTITPFPAGCTAKALLVLAFLAAIATATDVGRAAEVGLASPDGKIAVALEIKDDGPAEGCLFYRVSYQGKAVLADSRLGLELKEQPPLDRGFTIITTSPGSHDETWKPVYGERAQIRDHYNQLVVELQDSQQPPRRLAITLRAYDEGVALCYTIPKQPALDRFVIERENTQFRFTANYLCYATYSAQGVYEAVPLDRVKPNCERPLTVQIDGEPYVAVAEARLVDYARMRLQPVPGSPYTLSAMLASAVAAAAPYVTPWRVLMVADAPGQLLERNDLILNLNDPCAIADTSWIKPGKVIREVTLTTAGGKACVDFAVRQGLQYVEYDAGWYGHEYDDAADARRAGRDPDKSGVKGDLDLPEVIRYAGERGVGIILYVNRRALERQLDEILPLYQSWGVKGVKYGFVQVGSQTWTAWLHEAVRKAAEHRLMVDVHDEYRPTGYSRTYPNLMTQEGVHGNECMPAPENNLALPFTRFLCGAADCTVCWYCPRIKTTRAHQLGASIVFYSPWQFLYWYDRPEQCQGEPELDLFKHVPTVWDDTRVVQGAIGQYVTIARRSGREWYVGTLNAVRRRQLPLPLAFLDPGVPYKAYVYSDADPAGGEPARVSVAELAVDAKTVLSLDLAPNGGHAVRLAPILAESDAQACTATQAGEPEQPGRWSAEEAWQWYRRQPWIVGVNYLPSTACNTTEFWQAESFDEATIDRELALAHATGFNACRVFVQYLVWKNDPQGLKNRMDRFLESAQKHGIRTVVVLFDDCSFGDPPTTEPYLGKQKDPIPGMIAPSWTPSPGLKEVVDQNAWPDLAAYVKDVVGRFAQDERVLMWDLYNEPGNSRLGEKSLPLMEAAFGWAREAKPRQPVTTGVWSAGLEGLNRRMIELSDVITYHAYTDLKGQQAAIARYKALGRPVVCTEWMSRALGSRWDTDLPLFKREAVGCLSWGLVNGRMQCQFPWWSKRGSPEPAVWFHDLYRKDLTPYDAREIEVIRKTAVAN